MLCIGGERRGDEIGGKNQFLSIYLNERLSLSGDSVDPVSLLRWRCFEGVGVFVITRLLKLSNKLYFLSALFSTNGTSEIYCFSIKLD